jgi:DNA-binding transcriptional MerR regulator
MGHRLYQTGQFARKAAVSERTLRYYDRIGLLSPSCHSAAGHRLYSPAYLSEAIKIYRQEQ